MRRGAAAHEHPAGRQELGLCGLEQPAGALHVHAEAGAHKALAVGAPLGLHELLRELEAARVVARVVGPAERRLVGQLPDQVAAPQLERVEAELARGDVDRALHEVGGLGAARPAVGAGGDLVGAPAHHLHVGRADVVDAAHEHRGGVRRDRGGGHQVAAEVGPDAGTEGEHPALAVERQLHVRLHAASLVGRHEVLLAVLGPLDGAPGHDRRGRHEHRLGGGRSLAAEGAAHVRHDHVDRVLGPVEHGREPGQLAVAVLRRDPDREQILALVVGGDRSACLHRHGRQPWHGVARPHHVRRRREGGLHLAAALVPVRHRHAGAARVEHRVERLVVHLDELGGVLGERTRLGEHGSHQLARIAHLAGRQHGMAVARDLAALEALDGQIAGSALEVRGGDHGDHALQAVGGAHGTDPRVRERAAHERDVRRSVRVDVVQVARCAAQDALVLPPGKGAADEAARVHACLRPHAAPAFPIEMTSLRPGEASCSVHAAATPSSGTSSRSTARRPARMCSRSVR